MKRLYFLHFLTSKTESFSPVSDIRYNYYYRVKHLFNSSEKIDIELINMKCVFFPLNLTPSSTSTSHYLNLSFLLFPSIYLVSISSTFYVRVFHTKVLFLSKRMLLEKSCQKDFRTKNAHVKR